MSAPAPRAAASKSVPAQPAPHDARPTTAGSPLGSGLLAIFGITGDLSRRYLLPALYHLAADNLLPEHFEIVGVTRQGADVGELLAGVEAELDRAGEPCHPAALKRLTASMRIIKMDLTRLEEYQRFKTILDDLETSRGVCLNRLFYLSIPPQSFGFVVDFLGESGLNSGCQHGATDSRLMVEKPFGYDLASATALIEQMHRSFQEQQIFRIDHYLAKETAQNIMTFRFANPVFVPAWDRRTISRVTISAGESIGIEGRSVFYDSVGALRDVVQNHLLQLLSVVTMDEPRDASSAAVHQQKLELMRHVATITPEQVRERAVRGQYRGYRDEAGRPASATETFARLHLDIDSDRWRGVPIVLQTGKHLDRKATEVAVDFASQSAAGPFTNTLVFRLQPNEGIAIDLLAKKPGFDRQTERVEMAFNYENPGTSLPNAYERVLMDGIRGDQTLFASSAEVLESWRIVDAVVQAWKSSSDGLIMYDPGAALENIVQ